MILFKNNFLKFIFGCAGSSLLHELLSSCRSYSLVAVQGFLVAVASLVEGHGLWGTRVSVAVAHGLRSCGSRAPDHRLNSCGSRAYLLRGMWDLPGARIELMFNYDFLIIISMIQD